MTPLSESVSPALHDSVESELAFLHESEDDDVEEDGGVSHHFMDAESICHLIQF